MSVARTRREKDKRLHEIEMKIAALEGQQKELAAALEDPAASEPGRSATAINRESLRCRPRSCPPDGGMGKCHRHGQRLPCTRMKMSTFAQGDVSLRDNPPSLGFGVASK